MKVVGSALALLVLTAVPARAGMPTQGEIDGCRTNGDRVGRLICFDALFQTPAADVSPEAMPEASTPAKRKPSPLRELGLSQEQGRPEHMPGALVRIRPRRNSAFTEAAVIGSNAAAQTTPPFTTAADQRAWTGGADVFLTIREADGAVPPERAALEHRSVIMLACEDDITAFYILLPKPVSNARTKFAITTEQGTTFDLRWRDFENGDVILAGRGLESIDLIKSLASSRRLSMQIDYADGPQNYFFEIGPLAEGLRVLRRACHW